MNVSYGSVTMQVTQITQEVNAVTTPDRSDYLHTHVRNVINAVWHPMATSDTGKVAAESIANLRATLLTPRLPLIISAPSGGTGGSKILLRSPLLNPGGTPYVCDANNGPLPVGQPIIQVIGERMVLVQWVVETWIVECGTTLRPLLSHRWEMEEERDIDLYTTKTVTGEAYFNAAWLQSRTPVANVDDFRRALMHPIPDMFRRQNVRVKMDSGNTKLSYSFTDHQVPSRINPQYPNITRAFGWFSRETSQATPSDVSPIAGAINWLDNVIRRGDWSMSLNTFVFPKINLVLEAHVYGNSNATHRQLYNAMGAVLAQFKFRGSRVFGQDVDKWLAGLALTYSLGDERRLIARASAQYPASASTFQDVFGVGPNTANDTDLTQLSPVTLPGPGAAFAEPDNNKGAYGTVLERMAAQALGSPCSVPPDPQASPATPIAYFPN